MSALAMLTMRLIVRSAKPIPLMLPSMQIMSNRVRRAQDSSGQLRTAQESSSQQEGVARKQTSSKKEKGESKNKATSGKSDGTKSTSTTRTSQYNCLQT